MVVGAADPFGSDLSTVESDASDFAPLSSRAATDTESDAPGGDDVDMDDQPRQPKKTREFPVHEAILRLSRSTRLIDLGDHGAEGDAEGDTDGDSDMEGVGDVTIKESDVAKLRELKDESEQLAATTSQSVPSPMKKQGKRRVGADAK